LSGICGIFHLDGKPVEPEVLDRIMTTLSHRGPDGTGAWQEGPVGLGHLMLHTTPESLHEKLPLRDTSSDLVVTSDARIDNRDELFDALEIPHPEQAAMPDSALILNAYVKWGEDCPKHLLGDFVFVLWNKSKQQLFCARDQMGVKGLYYYHSPRLFAFASEIKGVLAAPNVPRRLNEIAMADYLIGNDQDLEMTFYEEILRLPPAHILVLTAEEFKMSRYWTPELGPELKLSSDEDYAEALREHMFQAVHCRMRSAFPVGVTLSGGLDSSSVACIAARRLREKGQRLIAVSSALPENHPGIETDEREYIEVVQRQEDNIDVEYVLAEGATPFDDLEGQFDRMDQPFRDLFYYMSDALYKTARKYDVRILLSGFGGDMAASFKGTGYMAQLARAGRWTELARLARRRAEVEDRSPWAYLKEVLGVLAPAFALRLYHRLKGTIAQQDLASLSAIHPAFAHRVGIKERCKRHGHSLPIRVPDARKKMLKCVSAENLADALECMATSQGVFCLEPLHPFLDRRIIEFCLTVPPGLHMQNGYKRSLLRQAMDGVLPPKVQWRTTKHPFTPDYHSRMLAAKPWILRFLHEAGAEERLTPFVDKAKIQAQLKLLKPVRGWNDWEAGTQMIVGRGIMVVSFELWWYIGNSTTHLRRS
jgi:asparagine synthase (glutamine-hydrolysing)